MIVTANKNCFNLNAFLHVNERRNGERVLKRYGVTNYFAIFSSLYSNFGTSEIGVLEGEAH